MSEPAFHFKPHPAAKQWLADKGLPADADPQLVTDQQMIWYGDRHVGYCGYKPGMGLCFLVHQEQPFIDLAVAFLTEQHGGPPKKPGNPPRVRLPDPEEDDDE